MTSKPSVVIKATFRHKAFLAVNVFILALLVFGFVRELFRNYSIEREIAYLEMERVRLEEKNTFLHGYQNYLSSEEFLEKEAREKFGLQRPGETQVYFSDDDSGVGDSDDVSEDISNAKKWFLFFFDAKHYEEKVGAK
jgi:cell division protein FtsB